MTKVFHVITDTNIGGAGRVLLQYLSFHNRKKYNIRVVLPPGSLLVPEIKKMNLPHIELMGISDRSFSIGSVLAFKALFTAEKPDIVHTHASLSARIGARLASKDIKIVHTRHTVSAVSRKNLLSQWVNKKINQHFSDIIIAVSPAAKENMIAEGTNEAQIKVVMNGITALEPATEAENMAYKEAIGITNNPFICALIARFEAVKGHEYMLDAAKILQDLEESVLFIVAGTGELEAEIKLRSESMKLDNILFLGFVSDIDKLENIMDIQINTSFFEGTSISLLEGMSLGKPAIATDGGGNPYVIKDGINGVIIPREDGKALAVAILEIMLNEALYLELSHGAHEVFKDNFTVVHMVRETEEIYRLLLKNEETS